MNFDIRTLILLNFIVNVINVGTMAIIWVQYRKRFAGLSFWLVNMLCHAIGIGLILMRGVIADFFAIVLSNTLLLCGSIFILIGLERFVGQRGRQFHNYALLAVYVCLTTYFYAVQPDMTMREIIMSAMIILFYSQIFWLLRYKVPPGLHQITRIPGLVISGYVVVSLVRMVLLIVFPLKTSDFFKSGFADSMAVTMYLSLHICLMIALVLMVTKRLLGEVQAQEEKFTKAFHSSPYAIMLTRTSDGKIFEVNDGFVNITGYQYAEAVGKTTLDLRLWAKEENRAEVIQQLSLNQKMQGVEIQIRKRTGELITGLFSADVIEINNEKYILSSISDITELSQVKQKLHDMATHDALTGLPNRTLFYDRFDVAHANAQRNAKKLAVMSLDLDKFKSINDRFGHAVGDAVLIETAKRLVHSLRKVDTVARFGGDEFVVLLWEVEQKDDAINVAHKIVEEFQRALPVDEHELVLTTSIGIALYPEDGTDAQTLLTKSDEALYYIKEHGKNNYLLYGDMIGST